MPTPITQYAGTWEQILTHAPQLAGQRVIVTVLMPDDAHDEKLKSAELLNQYRAFAQQELTGTLTSDDASRLREIERELDALELAQPHVHELIRRLDEGDRQLDHILAILDGKPPMDDTR